MVKASKLIKEIEKGNYKAKVTDYGDSYPSFHSVCITTDNNNVCQLRAEFIPVSDDAKYGVDEGKCEIEILGVTFSNAYITDEILVSLSGEIEYDKGLEEKDVIEAAEEHITWPSGCGEYNEDNLDPESLTDSEIRENYDFDDEYVFFGLNKDGKVCAYCEGDIVKKDCKVISEDEAIEILFKTRQGLYCEISYCG